MKPSHFVIVDDNNIEGILLANTVAACFASARITVLQRPEAVVELCRQSLPDCILIDYNMPLMDGLELGEALQKEMRYIPMILMTAVGDELLAADAIRLGFADYIPKSKINTESAARVIERAIRAIEQARLIDEQRDELENFAYALSHDFKQPIRQICTFSDLLRAQIGADDAGVERNLRFMSDAARRLGALVDVMSQYTLLNRPPELSMVDVGEVAEGVSAALQGFMSERNGAFVFEAAPVQVHGNAALLAQALQNLVINGLRYNTSERPLVTLRVEDGSPGRRLLRIEDNGIGIDARYIGEIFKPLVRLHSTAEFPGTGLGLTITRKAVTAQGGVIACESEPGIGSVFTVELPSDAPRAAENPQERAA